MLSVAPADDPPSHSRRGGLGDFGRAVLFALRARRRTPTFALIVIASLGFGLALATATLTVTNAYLIRSLPYPDAPRLYHVMYAPAGPDEPRGMTALDWNSVSDVVDAAIAQA